VRREVGEVLADARDALLVVRHLEVADARAPAVHARAAELLLRDLLADRRAHEVRAGQRHRAPAAHHRHEVRQAGDVRGPGRTRAPERGHLRDDAAGHDLLAEQRARPANSEPTASWMRAPALSSSQTNGIRFVSASSRSRATLISPVVPIEPAMTVKSYAHTQTRRPSTRPKPVITPSAGASRPSRPRTEWWMPTCSPTSVNEPGSTSSAIRSRAVSLPAWCWRTTRSGPPPAWARSRRAARSSASGRRIDGTPPAASVSVAMGLLGPRGEWEVPLLTLPEPAADGQGANPAAPGPRPAAGCMRARRGGKLASARPPPIPPGTPMSFPVSSALVLRQILDRAQIATVGGLLGVAVASYLDVADAPADPAEPDLFASLTSTHQVAIQTERSIVWCLERFGGARDVMETAAVAHDCARWLDAAYAELALARRRPRRWRRLLGRAERPAAAARAEAARGYAYAAMAYSEQVERLRELLAA